jgi:hypothetical protein
MGTGNGLLNTLYGESIPDDQIKATDKNIYRYWWWRYSSDCVGRQTVMVPNQVNFEIYKTSVGENPTPWPFCTTIKTSQTGRMIETGSSIPKFTNEAGVDRLKTVEVTWKMTWS